MLNTDNTFLGSYTPLLRLLVSEFTLSENPANTTTSQLRTACHADDSVILGTWLQETDHRTIEDQVFIWNLKYLDFCNTITFSCLFNLLTSTMEARYFALLTFQN